MSEKRKIAGFVVVQRPDGAILMGQNQEGKWCAPGGKAEADESPEEAATRELKEEAGIEVDTMGLLGGGRGEGVFDVYVFKAPVDKAPEPTAEGDPDEEFKAFRWVKQDELKDLDLKYGKRDVVLGLLGWGPRTEPLETTGDFDGESFDCEKSYGLARAVNLRKALADIKPGRRYPSGRIDYSHVLPAGIRQRYKILVEEQPPLNDGTVGYRSVLIDKPKNAEVGSVSGTRRLNEEVGKRFAVLKHSVVEPEHRGQGLGKFLYEAWLAHGRHAGATHVQGDEHSTNAGRVHEALAAKHGLDYKSVKNLQRTPYHNDLERDFNAGTRGTGNWDFRRGPYEYALKAEQRLANAVAMEPKPEQSVPTPAGQSKLVAVHNLTAANLKHAHELGGLAAPSLAIAHHDHVPSGFGEITLVAHPQMVDPSAGVPVHDADIYSPRHPSMGFKIKPKAYQKLYQELAPHAKATGGYVADLEEKIGADELHHDEKHSMAWPAFANAFLNEKGVRLQFPLRSTGSGSPLEAISGHPALQHFAATHGKYPDEWTSEHEKELTAAARTAAEDLDAPYAAATDDPDIAHLHRNAVDKWVQRGGGEVLDHNAQRVISQHFRDPPRQEVDRHRAQEILEAEVAKHPDFEDWFNKKLAGVRGAAYFSPNGRAGRKVPYTLDNIVAHVTKKLKQGEGVNSLGSARAAGATKFLDLQHIRNSDHNLVPHEQMEAHKKKLDEGFSKLSDLVGKYSQNSNSFSKLDDLSNAIGDSMKRGIGIGAALRRNGFTGVPIPVQQAVREFASQLRSAPTEYFEAKPQRAVGLHEFRGAAVPHDVSPETLQILHKLNIPVVHYARGDDADRSRAVRQIAEAQDLKLSEIVGAEPLHKIEAGTTRDAETELRNHVEANGGIVVPHLFYDNQRLSPESLARVAAAVDPRDAETVRSVGVLVSNPVLPSGARQELCRRLMAAGAHAGIADRVGAELASEFLADFVRKPTAAGSAACEALLHNAGLGDRFWAQQLQPGGAIDALLRHGCRLPAVFLRSLPDANAWRSLATLKPNDLDADAVAELAPDDVFAALQSRGCLDQTPGVENRCHELGSADNNQLLDVRCGADGLRAALAVVHDGGPMSVAALRQRGIDLRAYNLRAYVDAGGCLTTDGIRAALAAMPARHLGFTECRQGSENVLQINLGPDDLRALRAAGLVSAYGKLRAAAAASPLHAQRGLGWVRYTRGPDGIHVHEVRTPWGTELGAQLESLDGVNSGGQISAAQRQQLPTADEYRQLARIFWADRSPQDVLHEAFMEFNRRPGVGDPKETRESVLQKFGLDADDWLADNPGMSLQKGMRHMLWGLAVTSSLHAPPPAVETGGVLQSVEPENQSRQPPLAFSPAPPAWTPHGLRPELYPIAHLESSFGRNTNHAAHSGGEFHTAFGALGFKPVTAMGTYKGSRALQTIYPGLQDPQAFMVAFKSDPHFYNVLANRHFGDLVKQLGTADKAAFGWRWGLGAAEEASDADVDADTYVNKYRALSGAQRDRVRVAMRGQP